MSVGKIYYCAYAIDIYFNSAYIATLLAHRAITEVIYLARWHVILLNKVWYRFNYLTKHHRHLTPAWISKAKPSRPKAPSPTSGGVNHISTRREITTRQLCSPVACPLPPSATASTILPLFFPRESTLCLLVKDAIPDDNSRNNMHTLDMEDTKVHLLY